MCIHNQSSALRMWARFVRVSPRCGLRHHIVASHCRQRASLSSYALKYSWRRTLWTSGSAYSCCAASVTPPDGQRDTIAALSSGSGRCGVALLRVSGPGADRVLQSLLPASRPLPKPRHAVLSAIYHPVSTDLLDRALLLRFPGPNSFTGEDIAELHVHGGPAVVRAVLDALCSMPGVRLAEPGEFTRRAFELGKLDLTQAEGLADLLTAETEAQRKQALRQSTTAQKQQYESWRKLLLQCLANVEAVIDFGEDEGIAEEVAEQVLPRVQQLKQLLCWHLTSDRRGELVRSGVRVAIVGPPNVGKSSILNYLAGRRAAIVSATPGTTRDAIEVSMDISGYKVIVTDTAGMRQTLDPIEAEGVAVAHDTAQQADVVLSVRDCVTWLDSRASSPSDFSTQGPASQNFHAIRQHQNVVTVLNKADELTQPQLQLLHLSDDQSGKEQHSQPQQQQQNGAQLSIVHHSHLQQQQNGVEQSNLKQKNVQQVAQQAPLQQHAEWQSQQQGPEQQQQQISQHSGSPSVLSLTKVHPEEEAASRAMGPDQVQSVHSTQTVLCSCKTGWNMDAMAGLLEQSVQGIMQSGQKSEEALVITRARHRQHVEECTAALQRYEEVYLQLDIAAEELRAAAKALGRVTGVIDTEDLLDAIFREFCIGK